MKTFYIFYPFVSTFGGIERLIVYLSRCVCDMHAALVLVTFDNKVNFAAYGASELQVAELRGPRGTLSEVRRLRAFVRRHQISPQRILVFELKGAFYAGLAFRKGYSLQVCDSPRLLLRDVSKWSFSLSKHYRDCEGRPGPLGRIRAQAVYWLMKVGIHKARSRVTMSKRTVRELKVAFQQDFLDLALGVDVPATLPTKVSTTNGRVTFLSVCRLESSKRIDKLISAAATLILNHRQPVSVLIVGDGSQRSALEQLAQQLGVADSVEFTGRISDAQLEDVYERGDVFVMLAVQGWGLPGLEGLARHLRLIVHQDSGVSELLSNSKNVEIISDSSDSLVRAMSSLAKPGSKFVPDNFIVPTSHSWARSVCEVACWIAADEC